MKEHYSEYIINDPEICNGEATVKGTRIRIKIILDNLAEGHSKEEILKSYPSLTEKDVDAVIAFAAFAASDELESPVPELT